MKALPAGALQTNRTPIEPPPAPLRGIAANGVLRVLMGLCRARRSLKCV